MKNEKWLIKNLRRYTIEEIISVSYNYSLIYTTKVINNSIENNEVLPWHIDSLILMKVYVGDGTLSDKTLSTNLFFKDDKNS